jgi:GNAT superfamily N-acetyltransferase
MYEIKQLTPNLCSQLNAAAIVALHDNRCDLNAIQTTCFASETCMYGGSKPELNSLLYCNQKFVATKNDEFCGCIAADPCNDKIPFFNNIPCKPDALYVHTLCVEQKHRKQGLATLLLDKIKDKNLPIYLTVATGKGGKRNDLVDFFNTRSTKLVKFYEKQGFKKINYCEKYILLTY